MSNLFLTGLLAMAASSFGFSGTTTSVDQPKPSCCCGDACNCDDCGCCDNCKDGECGDCGDCTCEGCGCCDKE